LLDPNLSFPMTAIRPSPMGLGAMQASAQSAYARTMPDLRQTLEGVTPAQAFDRSKRSESQRTEVTIFHPSLGPSTEITESALMARALLSPTYVHDSAATRMARVSTMPNRELARFGGAVDIWA
jgi:hypothetical protein